MIYSSPRVSTTEFPCDTYAILFSFNNSNCAESQNVTFLEKISKRETDHLGSQSIDLRKSKNERKEGKRTDRKKIKREKK